MWTIHNLTRKMLIMTPPAKQTTLNGVWCVFTQTTKRHNISICARKTDHRLTLYRWMFSLKGWPSVSSLWLNWRNITCSIKLRVAPWKIWPSSPGPDYQFSPSLQVTHIYYTPIIIAMHKWNTVYSHFLCSVLLFKMSL